MIFVLQVDLHRVASNAYKQYSRSTPSPSAESVRRHKEMMRNDFKLATHPFLGVCAETRIVDFV